MAGNYTTTGSLADSKQLIIDSARIVREYTGVVKRTTENQKLDDNTGMSWEEISLDQLSAQTVTETTLLDNPQQMTDSILIGTPSMVGIEVCVTDLVYRRMPKMVIAKLGVLAQNAIERKADEDYIDLFATATTTLSGTGTTLSHGVIAAAATQIRSNTTEPGMGEMFAVLHGYQIKDLADEIRAGVGTYALPRGMTEEVFRQGFMGMTIDGVNIFEDGNISPDSTPDARGAVHSREAVVHVQGKSPWTETERIQLGGGADCLFYYDEYTNIERSAGNWLFGILSDATAPTS